MSATNVLCLTVPHYALALALRDAGSPACAYGALLADKPDRGRILAADDRARGCGARVGQTVLQARAAALDARVFVHDAERSRAVWHDMLDALDAVTPIVEDASEGIAYLDMYGIDAAPERWMDDVHRALEAFELPLRTAVAPNKFAARAAAYAGDRTTCDAGGMRRLLAPLPLDLLDIPARTEDRFRLLGVRTLGDIAKLPHGPFVRRFGSIARRWHDYARGIDGDPVVPRPHELHVDASMYGEGAATQEEQLVFALRMLADRVCDDLLRAGRAALLLRVEFECENGDARAVDVGLAEATADAKAMIDVVRAKLEHVSFTSPVSGLRLQALRLERAGLQRALFAQSEPDPQAVAVAIARLEASLGMRMANARLKPSHAFEDRFTYDPFEVPHAQVPGTAADSSGAVPQLRLLAVREIAVSLRGATPAAVGSPPQAVLDCAGPWRVEEGWFDAPVVRDEYDVLLADGNLYRIYRQDERWYLRGCYD